MSTNWLCDSRFREVCDLIVHSTAGNVTSISNNFHKYLRNSVQSNDKLCVRLRFSANYFKSCCPVRVSRMNDYFSHFNISSSNVLAHFGLSKYEVMKLVNNKFTYLNKLLMRSWCRKIIRKQDYFSCLSALHNQQNRP